ncbi:MAG: flagellar hook-length control protein FliK [Lachnospiraceae bacterium]|nr:flagellar hook-length control protein FliK [Lachnospiraceae bacterium]
MQIGNQVIRSYDTNIRENVRAEQTTSTENAGKVSSDVQSLSEGSVFRGEIVDVSGEKVTISTENKGEIIARLQADIELGVGDEMLFSVKENNPAQVLIKPLFDSIQTAQSKVLERALDAANLSPTEKNFSAAKELMEAGMPLDKGNMVKLLSQSMKFEGTSMHTLTALNKMNIPVTAENIAQFERYESFSHQLSGDIEQAADSMADFVKSMPSDMEGNELLNVAKELTNIISGETNNSAEVNQTVAANETASNEGAVLDNAQTNVTVKGQEGALQAEGLKEGATVADNNIVNTSEVPNATATAGDTQNINNKGIEVPDKQTQITGAVKAAFNASEGVVDKTEVTRSLVETVSDNTGLAKEEVTNLSSMLKNTDVPGEQVRQIFEQSTSSTQLVNNMLEAIKSNDKNGHAIKSLLSSNEFKKLFSDMIQKEFSLNPSEMKDPKEIENLYNRIIRQTEAFENTINAKGGDSGNMHQNSQNMQQNMQFMEQLNNHMIYAQMPIKLNNQNANSELYVYADKRKLAGKRDDISVMLHLDMDHLGATDVKVTLTGTNVNARFYLNDKESVEIVASNMGELADKLAERGFTLTNEVVKRESSEAPNKVINEFIDSNAERSIKRFTFDAKT